MGKDRQFQFVDENGTLTGKNKQVIAVTNSDGTNVGSGVSEIQGNVDSDNPETGKPIAIGGLAVNSAPTDVDILDRVMAIFTQSGEQIIAGYDYINKVIKSVEQAPTWARFIDSEALVDTTNLAINTYYYPSSDGLPVDGYNSFCLDGNANANITYTIEGTINGTWKDITKACYNLLTDSTGAASFVNADFLLDLTKLNVSKIRLKAVVANATNVAKVFYRKNFQ